MAGARFLSLVGMVFPTFLFLLTTNLSVPPYCDNDKWKMMEWCITPFGVTSFQTKIVSKCRRCIFKQCWQISWNDVVKPFQHFANLDSCCLSTIAMLEVISVVKLYPRHLYSLGNSKFWSLINQCSYPAIWHPLWKIIILIFMRIKSRPSLSDYHLRVVNQALEAYDCVQK